MKDRCYNRNHDDYYNYGDRGITVCENWLNNFWEYVAWITLTCRMQDDDLFEVHRKNNDLGYSPENCECLPSAQHQAMPKRKLSLAEQLKKAYLLEQRLRLHYNYQDADFVKMYENDTEIAAENFDKASEKSENPVI